MSEKPCTDRHDIPAGFCEVWYPCGCHWKGEARKNGGGFAKFVVEDGFVFTGGTSISTGWTKAKRPAISD